MYQSTKCDPDGCVPEPDISVKVPSTQSKIPQKDTDVRVFGRVVPGHIAAIQPTQKVALLMNVVEE